MQFHIFAIPATGSTDLEEEMNHFLRSHKVVSVKKSIEVIDGLPRWCFCVEYIAGTPIAGVKGAEGRSKRVDYKEILSNDDFVIFSRLREVRKELAAAEAIPVYAVCTNEQLATLARKCPTSLVELKEIDGLGKAKVGKYGDAFLFAIAETGKNRDETSREPD